MIWLLDRLYPAFGGEVSDPPAEECRQVHVSEDGGQDEKRENHLAIFAQNIFSPRVEIFSSRSFRFICKAN